MGERTPPVSSTTATEWDGTAAPASVSVTLREARERLGVELRDAASMLRIRFVYLQAIENGRFDELPGAAYAMGFLRSYAEFLGLDPEAVLRRYKEEASGPVGKQAYYLPTPATESRVPGGTLLLGTLVLAGTVYGAWYYLSATDRSMADMVPVLPDRLVSLLDNLPWSGGSQPPQTATAPEAPTAPPAQLPTTTIPPAPVVTVAPPSSVAAAPATPPAQGGTSSTPTPAAPAAAAPAPAVAAAPPPRPATPTPQAAAVPHAEEDEVDMAAQEPTPLAPVAPAPAPAAAPPPPPPVPAEGSGKVYGSQNASARVQVRAVQDSWVQVRDSQEIIFTRVLKAGDTYRVPERAGVRLRTGNAGGLVLVTDGVAGQPMGSVGQVLRDVPLDGSAKPAR